jgi:hypothetical protein
MKTQIILIIIGSLLLGLVIGVLATGRFTQHKVEQIKEMGTPDGIHKRLFHMIDPTDAQHDSIKPILREFARKSDELRRQHWQEHRILFNEMLEQLTPLLTNEQLERLENFKKRSPIERYRKPGEGRKYRHRQNQEEGRNIQSEKPYRNREHINN